MRVSRETEKGGVGARVGLLSPPGTPGSLQSGSGLSAELWGQWSVRMGGGRVGTASRRRGRERQGAGADGALRRQWLDGALRGQWLGAWNPGLQPRGGQRWGAHER